MAGIPDRFTEVVSGEVIGDITWRYEFWKDGKMLARREFANDIEATDWFKANHVERAVEMRVFDSNYQRALHNQNN